MAETALNLSVAARHLYDLDGLTSYGEQALTIAHDLEHPQLLANSLMNLSFANMAKRQWAKGAAYAVEAQQQYEALGNLIKANDAQQAAGACRRHYGRAQAGLKPLEKALAFAQQIEIAWGQAEASRFLALVHVELGHYGQAITLAKQAYNLTCGAGHVPFTLAKSVLAIVQRTIMKLDMAQENQLSILNAFAAGGFDPYPDLTLAELCTIHALAGAWDQAYEYAQKARQFHADGALLPMATTGYYETEALLRGGDGDLARAEVERIAGVVGSNRRQQLPLLRSQAVLAQWDGELKTAVSHLEAALNLAREMELLGEEWPILGQLGRLYGELEEEEKAQEAYGEAGTIIHRLAETIEDEGLREGFVTAVPTRSILERSEVM